MAGIFSDVSTDIQKLRQLKAEIESVKKALKQINVKVDIDIAKGMEAQLKSLMGQYDALVAKVSEAEGKIMLSTKRINEASEKIIKAQEQLSKGSGVSPQSGNGNKPNTVGAGNAETASVQAQAKAYDELEAEINKVLGTREQNIRKLIEESNAIKLNQKLIKQTEKEYTNSNGVISEKGLKLLEIYNNNLLRHKATLSEVQQVLRNEEKLYNASENSMARLSQELSRMRIAYRVMTDDAKNSPFGRELLASINQADAKIKELDATIGNHQRNVGNYASGWNGLNMSVQQIVRELPAATMGLNMFFLAISNNLPMLTDEIKRAKTANEELKKSGQKGVPVWKQLASSLFSWQSALMVGITLLSMYGKEIWNWVGSLFGADEAQKRLNESVKDFTSVLNEGQTQARLLFDAVKQTEEGTKGRAEAIEKINAAYGKYLPNLLSEKTSLIELRSAYELVNKALLENAAAKAKASAMDKVLDGSLEKQADAIEGMNKVISSKYGDKYASSMVKDVMGWTDKYISMGNSKDSLLKMFAVNAKFKGMPDGFREYLEEYVNSVYETNEEIKKIQGKYNPFFDKKKADEAIIQNKQYWSKQREIYVKELEKLSDEEAAGEKGKELKVKIENIDKRLEPYSIQKQDNKPTKDPEAIKQEQQRLYDELLELRFKNEQDEINAMEDGREKKRAQLDLDFQMEYAEIKKLEKLWSEKNGGTLTQEQTIEISRRYTNAENKYDKGMEELEGGFTPEELRKSMNEYLAIYGEYQDKRKAIIALGEEKKKSKNKWEQKTIDKETSKQLSELDEEAYKTTSAITRLFGDMKEKTLKDLKEINEKGKEALEFLKGGEWDALKGKEFGITEANFKEWSQDPEKIKAATDAIKQNQEAIDELRPVYDKVTDGVRKFFDAGSDPKKVTEALQDIQNGLNGIMQTTSFLSDMFSSLGDSFGSDTLSGIADGLNVAMDAANSAMQGAQAGAMFGGIGAAAGAAIGLVGSFASSIAKIHDKKNEKQIQKLQDQIDALDKSYDKLSKSVEEAYSKDASRMIEQQNKLLEQQKVLIQQQIREEQDKKKTDDNRIKEWQQQIEEINSVLDENKEKMVDVIFGEDVQSAIECFSSAVTDMWASNVNGSQNARNAVKQMMQQMATESIKSFIQTHNSMEQIRQKLQQFYMDNALSGWEQDYIYSMADELQKEIDRQFGWAEGLFKDDAQGQQSASGRGFGTEMTHEDAGELSGRFTAVYESSLRIETATQQQTVAITELKGFISDLISQTQSMYNIADETRTILANSYLELQEIRENTGEIIKPIKQMQKDIAEVKRNTSRL